MSGYGFESGAGAGVEEWYDMLVHGVLLDSGFVGWMSLRNHEWGDCTIEESIAG